jgi:hypothetical protein
LPQRGVEHELAGADLDLLLDAVLEAQRHATRRRGSGWRCGL